MSESEVIKIMRKNLKSKSFKIWRERVSGRTRKHEKKRILSTKSEKIELALICVVGLAGSIIVIFF